MKWKVTVVQYNEPIYVEAETRQEAEKFVAEETFWESEYVRFEVEPEVDKDQWEVDFIVESDKNKEIRARFATDNDQLLLGG